MVSEGARRVGIELLGAKLSMVSIEKKLERALSPEKEIKKLACADWIFGGIKWVCIAGFTYLPDSKRLWHPAI